MKMRTNLGKCRNRPCEILRNDPGFQRTKTYSPDSAYLMNCQNQLKQVRSQIYSVGAEMNACQHHFLIPVRRQPGNLPQNVFYTPAPDSSSRIRDNAVAAKLITSVLNLNIRSGMLRRPADKQIFILTGMVHIYDIFFPLTLLIFLKNLHQISFFIISDHQINRIVRFQLFFCRLYIASHRCYHCLRIHLFCLMQHLSGLAVSDIRNRTGIDYVNIRSRLKRNNLVSCLFQHLLHRLCLICVYFAPQVMQGSFLFHIISFLSVSYFLLSS